jgi:hypothetical protein
MRGCKWTWTLCDVISAALLVTLVSAATTSLIEGQARVLTLVLLSCGIISAMSLRVIIHYSSPTRRREMTKTGRYRSCARWTLHDVLIAAHLAALVVSAATFFLNTSESDLRRHRLLALLGELATFTIFCVLRLSERFCASGDDGDDGDDGDSGEASKRTSGGTDPELGESVAVR